MKRGLPPYDKTQVNNKFKSSSVFFVIIAIGVLALVIFVIASLTKDDEPTYFTDEVWTQSACAGVTNPSKFHPCYVLGSDGSCPLDVSHYHAESYMGITYYMQHQRTTYMDTMQFEIELLFGCHSIDFSALIDPPGGTHRQPYILLLDDYADAKWPHYSSGSGDCDTDKRIVFPREELLVQHHGVLIHEFAHYFQDILHSWDVPGKCDFHETLIQNYNNPAYGDGGVWGTRAWPYCYGLTDGSRGVPNVFETMAILTEGACAISPEDARYDTVCGPSSAYLMNISNEFAEDQHLCLEQLYSQDFR